MILPRCYEETYLSIRYSSYATLSATRSLCWHHVELYFTYLVQYAFLLGEVTDHVGTFSNEF